MYRLSELGIKATYDHFDAGRDITKLAGYLRDNRRDLLKKDLIYTFGTTTTLTVQNFHLGNVPQVFNIVTDPIGTGVTRSIEAPTNGATGAKLSLPPEEILQALETILPYKTIAILFDPREVNATLEADKVSIAAEAMGKHLIRFRLVPDKADLEAQIADLRPQLHFVDVAYVASTSSFMAHPGLLRQVIPDHIVSISSSPKLVDHGITLAFGDEYWRRGEAAADVAAKILLENKLPHQVPIDEISPDEAILFVSEASPAKERLNLQDQANIIKYR